MKQRDDEAWRFLYLCVHFRLNLLGFVCLIRCSFLLIIHPLFQPSRAATNSIRPKTRRCATASHPSVARPRPTGTIRSLLRSPTDFISLLIVVSSSKCATKSTRRSTRTRTSKWRRFPRSAVISGRYGRLDCRSLELGQIHDLHHFPIDDERWREAPLLRTCAEGRRPLHGRGNDLREYLNDYAMLQSYEGT